MVKDMTDEGRAFWSFLFLTVGFSLAVSSALFAFAYYVLGRIDVQLSEARRRLQEELDKQSESNALLQREIAERRKAEADVLALNETLECRVFERTKALDQLNQDLRASRDELKSAYRNLQAQQATILQQDKMACIGQLAASVAHDINSPNGFVIGNLELLREYFHALSGFIAYQDALFAPSLSPAQQKELQERRQQLAIDVLLADVGDLLADTLEGAAQIHRTVLNLKGFARADDDQFRFINIHDCIDSTLNIVANELRYKADITKEYGDLPPLFCNPQQMNQVFMNLFINASQAIVDWGTLHIRTWRDGQTACIAIRDTGIGMTPEQQGRIFEPFYTTKPVGVGTGLGLSIVKEIVEQHKGTIYVESSQGVGTQFTLHFPIVTSEETL